MSSETLVKTVGVSKKFCKTLKRSMIYGAQDIVRQTFGLTPATEKLRRDEFWAVSDVSFEVRRGGCLGLIGPNGAGKSTLLKMLSGIILPDQGTIEVHGRVGALIELGAGFHPMLTGRENIYINGCILGLTKKEVDAKFNSIVDFAGLEDFIDTPVKFYSSGMYVRLGFAVAAHLNPDVLILDEVLAVGDAGFRARCYDAIYARLQDSAVILVSHNMVHINRMCDSVVLLDKGIPNHFSSPADAIKAFYDLVTPPEEEGAMRHGNGQAHIENMQVKGTGGADKIVAGQPFEVSFELFLEPSIKEVSIVLSTLSREQIPIAYTKSIKGCIVNTGKKQIVRFVTPSLTLAPEKYSLSIVIFDESVLTQILWHYNISPFTVLGKEDFIGVPVKLVGDWIAT